MGCSLPSPPAWKPYSPTWKFHGAASGAGSVFFCLKHSHFSAITSRRIWDSTPANGQKRLLTTTSQTRPKQQEQIMNSSNIDLKNSIDRSPVLRAFLLIAVALACFALSPIAHAVSPAPDGGYAGGNTAEGDNALFGLTTGDRKSTRLNSSHTVISYAVFC